MTRWHCLSIVLVVLASSCQPASQFPVRPHTERDTLEYLVSNADLIAIVEVADSNGGDSDPKKGFQPTVTATLTRVLKGSGSTGQQITLAKSASQVPEGVHSSVHLFENGDKVLVFLVERDGRFAPLTDQSALDVLDDDQSVTPIWRRYPETATVKIPGIPLEEAVADITRAIDTSTNRVPSTEAEQE